MEFAHTNGQTFDAVSALLHRLARLQLVQQRIRQQCQPHPACVQEVMDVREEDKALILTAQQLTQAVLRRQARVDVDVDSGTESDKDYRSTPISSVTPAMSCVYHGYALNDASHGLQTHLQSASTCPSYPIYSQNKQPLQAHRASLASAISWNITSGSTICNSTDSYNSQPLSSLSSSSSSFSSSSSAPLSNNSSRLTERILSQDSCVECDGYNSEDELASINGFIDEDDDDDDDEVMQITINPSEKPLCKQGGFNNNSWQRNSMVDEGFLDDDSSPLPVKFCATPPQGVLRSRTDLSPQMFWACVRGGCVNDSATQWPPCGGDNIQ